jgi:hypothetical protein
MYRRSTSENNRICRRLDYLFSARKHGGHMDETTRYGRNLVENWSEQNGFRFAQTKTVMIHYCRMLPRRNPHVEPKISLKGHDVKLVDSH